MPRKFRLSHRKDKKRAALAIHKEELESSKKARLDGVSEDLSDGTRLTSATQSRPDERHADGAGDGSMFPFHKFRMHKVLFTDPRSKSICVLGSCSAGGGGEPEERGIVVAEKQPLTESSLAYLFSSPLMEKKFQNDVYSQYVLNCKEGGLGEVRLTTVYPATDKHVQKYEAQKRRFVLETPASYRQITKPFAEKQSLSLDWVFNILDGKSEVERVIYRDDDPDVGFALVPDLKWDQKELENLYVLAIAMKRGVLSLRELRAEHLPMLRNILHAGKREICNKYSGVEPDQLRVYLHYQPSYYHLHVHFTHLQFSAPKSAVGDAHLLEDVIDNISAVDPMFYAKRTLSFVVKESSMLWDEFARGKEER